MSGAAGFVADLEGRVALVTGASAGLGLASARALAARGARVALNSRGGARLEEARRLLAADGADVVAVAADLSEADAAAHLVGEVEGELGAVEVLVANSGGPPVKRAVDLDDADWAAAIDGTFLFVPRLCRAVLPSMLERGWGRVIAINSVSARQPIPGLALSNALRPAVLGYLKTLSREIAAHGVTVNAVLPGHTLTERQQELARAVAKETGQTPDEILAERAAGIPAQRIGSPAELAAAVCFLASPAASYVTGQFLAVDGGLLQGLL